MDDATLKEMIRLNDDAALKEMIRRSQYFQFFAGWGEHLFFQTDDHAFWGCGRNDCGQLSIGTKKNVLSPVKITFFTPGWPKREILGVSLGVYHTLFQTRSGAFSAGSNSKFQLSDSTTESRSMAVSVILEDENAKIRSVFAGLDCSFFLTGKGDVFSAGPNDSGQLGHLDPDFKHVPIGKKILFLSDIVQIVTGASWAIFRSKSNALFGCGRNYGQFGIGNTESQLVPAEISFFKDRNIKIDFLVSSTTTAYFVTPEPESQVYCSGRGVNGQFGNGQDLDSVFPVLSRPLSGFQILCSGHTDDFMMTKKNDEIYGCGICPHVSWRFGLHHFTAYTPVKIDDIPGKDVMQLATRESGTYAICQDGSIYVTGKEGWSGAMMYGKQDEDYIKKFSFVGRYRLMKRGGTEREEFGKKYRRLTFLVSRLPVIQRILFVCQ